MSLRVLSYGASSLGLLLIAIPVLHSTIGSIQTAIKTQQLEVKLRRMNYSFSVNHPPKLDMRAFKPNEHIQVFDNNGVCIGRIRNQKFEFKVHYLNTCLTINPTDKIQGRNQ